MTGNLRIRNDKIGKTAVSLIGLFIVFITIAITAFLLWKGSATFTVHKDSILGFILGSLWDPTILLNKANGPNGAAIFITGSILISGLALLIATPFALACAVFVVEISPKLGERFLRPAIELFAGIPSVIYGWVGISVLCPFLAKIFNMPFGGESVLAGALVLAVMIFPTISTVAADAIKNVPAEYSEASYGLGATRWHMIKSVRLPAAKSGILTGVILGLSRAFGEALAVSMVIGGRLAMPKSLLSQTSTLTTQIASGMGTAVNDTQYTDSLWSMALLLLIISFAFILLIRIVGKKKKD